MTRPVRVLIAPDKFKGTLTAERAANAVAAGVRNAAHRASVTIDIDICPVADGGEGTAEIIAGTWGERNTTWNPAMVTGPIGVPVTARWAASADGTAVFDSAAACGLALVPEARRDPARCTTGGVGKLLTLAARNQVGAEGRMNQVLVALGGSATIDAGIGLAAAIGWRFLDNTGREIESPLGADLSRVSEALPPARERRAITESVRVRAMCDVSTALIGPEGCAAAFGPQKGATPTQVRGLDDALRRFVEVIGVPPIERDGSAGGLAYGLRVFAGATLESGSAVVFEAQRVAERVAGADIVFTGEGRFDRTSLQGKAVGELLRVAAGAGVYASVIAGSVDADAPTIEGDEGTVAPCPGDMPPLDRDEAAARVTLAAELAFAEWLGSGGGGWTRLS